jgi:hypothetical protein
MPMKNSNITRSLKITVLLIGIGFLLLTAIPAGAQYPPPPPYAFSSPPHVVVIPNTYVYMVPDITVSIFFYNGYWWRPWDGRWYRARYYNGPWLYVAPRYVPYGLVHLPPYYRYVPRGYNRIPYYDLRRNWRAWERNRYWERHDYWHREWAHPEERRGMERGRGRGRR